VVVVMRCCCCVAVVVAVWISNGINVVACGGDGCSCSVRLTSRIAVHGTLCSCISRNSRQSI